MKTDQDADTWFK